MIAGACLGLLAGGTTGGLRSTGEGGAGFDLGQHLILVVENSRIRERHIRLGDEALVFRPNLGAPRENRQKANPGKCHSQPALQEVCRRGQEATHLLEKRARPHSCASLCEGATRSQVTISPVQMLTGDTFRRAGRKTSKTWRLTSVAPVTQHRVTMSGSQDQFSLARAALSRCGRAKCKFLLLGY